MLKRKFVCNNANYQQHMETNRGNVLMQLRCHSSAHIRSENYSNKKRSCGQSFLSKLCYIVEKYPPLSIEDIKDCNVCDRVHSVIEGVLSSHQLHTKPDLLVCPLCMECIMDIPNHLHECINRPIIDHKRHPLDHEVCLNPSHMASMANIVLEEIKKPQEQNTHIIHILSSFATMGLTSRNLDKLVCDSRLSYTNQHKACIQIPKCTGLSRADSGTLIFEQQNQYNQSNQNNNPMPLRRRNSLEF